MLVLLCCFVGSFFTVYSPTSHESVIKADESKAGAKAATDGVEISKTATPVAGMVNQWDIKLRIEAQNLEKPPETDIVLVMDISTSMLDEKDGVTRIDKAKEAAVKFVEEILQSRYNNRIALVSYNKKAETHEFTIGGGGSKEKFVDYTNKQLLIDKINSLKPIPKPGIDGGGTNTQGGIRYATNVMKEATKNRRDVVLISDGVPTFSYRPKSPYDTVSGMENFPHPTNPSINAYQTIKTIPESHFDYLNLIGMGQSYLTNGSQVLPVFPNPGAGVSSYVNHANSAIAESTIAKNRETTILGEKLISNFYTIGVDLDLQINTHDIVAAKESMKEIASSPDKNFLTNSDELIDILQGISGTIISPIQQAMVTDPMGKGFELTNAVTSGNATQGKVIVSSDKRTIGWDVGGLATPISNDPNEDIMYAELNYRVSANNDVLQAGVINVGGEALTNGVTTLNYKDPEGNSKTENFDVPKVKPIIVSLEKKLFDENGTPIVNDTEAFAVKYGDDEYTKNDTFSIYPNNKVQQIVHPWKADKDYSVEEILTTSQKFDTKIEINGQETTGTTTKFKFSADPSNYVHQKIVIKNTQLARLKKIILNIRQSVIKPHNELVIPSKGYFTADVDGTNQKINLNSGSTIKDTPAEVNESLFTSYEILLPAEQVKSLTVSDLVPEYYRFYGFIATPTKTDLNNKHISANTGDLVLENKAKLDYSNSDTYWLTMFITPKLGIDDKNNPEESPRPYSWSYKTNQFGN